MERVEREDLEALADEWDALAADDAGVDPFCARSAWPLAYHDAFEPDRPLHLIRREGALVVLAESRRHEGAGLLEPLENMWGFASPLIGHGAAGLLADALLEGPRPVLLLGLPTERARLRPLAERLRGAYGARALEPTSRFVASLEGGLDGWLGRRSASFRRGLRASERRAEAEGIDLRRIEPSDREAALRLYDRMLDVERRSWKGRSGRGVDQEPMRGFYAELLPRLADRGELRIVLAERDGQLVGYLHGGLVRGHFRGLQFSFDAAHQQVGLGNRLQLEMLRWLCDEGALRYDLGGQSAYKARWGEQQWESLSLLIQPR